MKKALKILILILGIFLTLLLVTLLTTLIMTAGVKLDESKLVDLENTVTFYSLDGEEIISESNNLSVTPFSDIPDHVKNAFIAIEDKRFYEHNGIDYKRLFKATFNNLKSFSFKEGASTISQQLIKNTHLSSEKTIKRKLLEIKLAKELERKYSKEEILEKYLNTIYFGDNCFGITEASNHYFSKPPEKLSVSEGALLAGIIKAPTTYSPFSNLEKCIKRRNLTLKAMSEQGFLSNEELIKFSKDTHDFNCNNCYNQNNQNSAYLSLVKKELLPIFEKIKYRAKKYKVYLNLDQNAQKRISNIDNYGKNSDFSIILIDKDGKILAYNSSVIDIKRQVGSTIKPILVYAPSINQNLVDSSTFIVDEPINFSGYSPSNYNDKYYGYVTVKESLEKSLNSCSVKLLNSLGVENALKYAKKLDIELTENDKNLGLALGSTENGISLNTLTKAYLPFLNQGNFVKSFCVDKITDQDNKILYKHENIKENVFDSDTVDIINDALNSTVKNGTANKLKDCGVDLCAKTGTVGNKNGNTDAYCISYNSELLMGVWLGNKDNSLMDNSITGGNYPTLISKNVWANIYKNKTPPKAFNIDSAVNVKLDKLSLEEKKIELASENTPERFLTTALFKKDRIPTVISERFSSPKIENAKLLENNKGITIELCLTELYDFCIYREENGVKTLIYDSKKSGKKKTIIDNKILEKHEYVYSILPYFVCDDNKILGKEFIFDKIKILPKSVKNDWWQDDDFI